MRKKTSVVDELAAIIDDVFWGESEKVDDDTLVYSTKDRRGNDYTVNIVVNGDKILSKIDAKVVLNVGGNLYAGALPEIQKRMEELNVEHEGGDFSERLDGVIIDGEFYAVENDHNTIKLVNSEEFIFTEKEAIESEICLALFFEFIAKEFWCNLRTGVETLMRIHSQIQEVEQRVRWQSEQILEFVNSN